METNSVSYLSAFLGGLLVGFSPCVYPLIPITLAFIGSGSGSSRLRGFILSLVYVLGLAITYSVLGLIASATGKLFGRIANHPAAYFVIGNACIISGLSFFDIININFTGAQIKKKIKMTQGVLPVLLLGLASGLVAGPCVTPVLGTILVYAASKQNVIYGASLLFVFAYGMGILLILAGTFSAVFANLSKSSTWILRLRKISGFILIGAGEYFLIKAGSLIW